MSYSSDGTCGKSLNGQPSEMLPSLNHVSAKEKCHMTIAGTESNSATKLVTDKVLSYVTVTDDRVNLTFSFPKSDFDLMSIISKQIDEIRLKNAELANKSYPKSSISNSSEDVLTYQKEIESRNSANLNKSFLSEITKKCDINNSEDIATSYMKENNFSLCMNSENSKFQNDRSEQQKSLKTDEQRVSSSLNSVGQVTDKQNFFIDVFSTEAQKTNTLDVKCSKGKDIALEDTAYNAKDSIGALKSIGVDKNTLSTMSVEGRENTLDEPSAEEEENALDATAVDEEENVLDATSAEEENVLDATSAEEEKILAATSAEEEKILAATSAEEEKILEATSVGVIENVLGAMSNEQEENVLDATSAEQEENVLDATSAEQEENSSDATSVKLGEKTLDKTTAVVDEKALDVKPEKVRMKASDAKPEKFGKNALDETCIEGKENALHLTSADVKENALSTTTFAEEEENILDTTSGAENVLNAAPIEMEENVLKTSSKVEENASDGSSAGLKENATYKTSANVEEKAPDVTSEEVGEKGLDANSAGVEGSALYEIFSEVRENSIDETTIEDKGNTSDEISFKMREKTFETSLEKVEKTFDATSTEDEKTLDATFTKVDEKTIYRIIAEAIKTLDGATTEVGKTTDFSADVRKTEDAKSTQVEKFSDARSAGIKGKTLDGTSAKPTVKTLDAISAAAEVKTNVKEKTLDPMSAAVESVINAFFVNVENDMEATADKLEGNVPEKVSTEAKESFLRKTRDGVEKNSRDTSCEVKEKTLYPSSAHVVNVQDAPCEVRHVPESTSVELERNVEATAPSEIEGNILVELGRNTKEAAPTEDGNILDTASAEEGGNIMDAKSSKVGENAQETVPTEIKGNISDSTPSKVEENFPDAPATLVDGSISVATSNEIWSVVDATCPANSEDVPEEMSINVEHANEMTADKHDLEEKPLFGASMSYEFKERYSDFLTEMDKKGISDRALSLPEVLETNIFAAVDVKEIKETSSSKGNLRTGSAVTSELKEKKNGRKVSENVKGDIKNKRMESRSKIQLDDVDSAPTRARSKVHSSTLLRVPEDSVVSKFNRSASTGKTSPMKRSLRSKSLDTSPTKTPGRPSLDKKLTTPSKAPSGSIDIPDSEKRTRQTAIKKEIKIPVRSSPRKAVRAASVPKETSKRDETNQEGAKSRSAQNTSTLKTKRGAKK